MRSGSYEYISKVAIYKYKFKSCELADKCLSINYNINDVNRKIKLIFCSTGK